MIRRLKEELKNSDIPFEQEVNAKKLSTFRIGGTVSLLVRPRCEEELIEAALLCRKTGLNYAVIGKGSNLLFGDGRIDTALLQTTEIDAVRLTKTGVRAACGDYYNSNNSNNFLCALKITFTNYTSRSTICKILHLERFGRFRN